MSSANPGPRVTRVRAADDEWGVTTVEGGSGAFRKHPCAQCPWRRDAPVGAFPAEAFRLSAPTAYDMATEKFGCHDAGSEKPAACAGFPLRGASDNLAVRMSHRDFSGVHTTVPLYDSYREMAVANGVDPDDPVLAPCRGDRPMEYLSGPDDERLPVAEQKENQADG